MNCNATRILTLALVLPLTGFFVASAMSPANAQDPKPAPEAKGEPREGQRPDRGEGRRPGGRGGPSLHSAMEQLGTEFEKVMTGIADPAQNEATIQSLGRMIQMAGASQNGEPKNMAKIPADAQAAYKLEFRRALTVLARDIAEVELLVIDGKNEEAVKLFDAKVLAAADPAHAKFAGGDEVEARPEGGGGTPK